MNKNGMFFSLIVLHYNNIDTFNYYNQGDKYTLILGRPSCTRIYLCFKRMGSKMEKIVYCKYYAKFYKFSYVMQYIYVGFTIWRRRVYSVGNHQKDYAGCDSLEKTAN